MNVQVSPQAVLGGAVALAALFAMAPARADAVSDAKAAVAKYAGPQTTWEGPTALIRLLDKGIECLLLSQIWTFAASPLPFLNFNGCSPMTRLARITLKLSVGRMDLRARSAAFAANLIVSQLAPR